MRSSPAYRASVLIAAALLLFSACAGTGDLASFGDDEFKTRAAEVFVAGFGGVADKYIEPVAVHSIAIDGMRGLGSIDPALTVARDEGRVVLFASGREVARRPAPNDGDVVGWANVAADISLAARRASSDLRSANIEALYEAVFDGVLSRLDIFSRYAGAVEARKNRAKREGFGGIGIRYQIEDGVPVINDVLAGTPAATAGLRKGDRIFAVDGAALKGLARNEVSDKLRGPIHSTVELTIDRPGQAQLMVIGMERGHIFGVTVTASHKDGILYLKVGSFNQDTARALADEIEKGRAALGDGMKGVILDLRGNPGGLLKQSVKVADLLLTQGQIISTRGRHADSIHYYEAGGRDLAFGMPVIVLVDGKSASAAEIVAAALQDRERAVVIGTSSFGKGSVQTVIRLPNDGEITLTWSRLYAPSGYLLHGLGVLPAICTSGVKEDARSTIRVRMAQRAKTEEALNAWRLSAAFDDAKRGKLRESCPSQRRQDDLEIEMARQLLGDQALYAEALRLSAATHQAHY